MRPSFSRSRGSVRIVRNPDTGVCNVCETTNNRPRSSTSSRSQWEILDECPGQVIGLPPKRANFASENKPECRHIVGVFRGGQPSLRKPALNISVGHQLSNFPLRLQSKAQQLFLKELNKDICVAKQVTAFSVLETQRHNADEISAKRPS